MTHAEYQKRLDDILLLYRYYTGGNPSDREQAKQALTALCREVCGEVLGEDEEDVFGIAKLGEQAQITGNVSAVYNAFRREKREALEAILGQPQEDK